MLIFYYSILTFFLDRGLRKYYERGMLKDLYHRRILAGAEPLSHRAFLPNWYVFLFKIPLKNK